MSTKLVDVSVWIVSSSKSFEEHRLPSKFIKTAKELVNDEHSTSTFFKQAYRNNSHCLAKTERTLKINVVIDACDVWNVRHDETMSVIFRQDFGGGRREGRCDVSWSIWNEYTSHVLTMVAKDRSILTWIACCLTAHQHYLEYLK